MALEAPCHGLGERAEVVLAATVLDAEAAVLGALGGAVLEHDHRRDRVRVLEVRDVEALDADRQRLEVERLAQLLEPFDAARARALRAQHVVTHSQLGVAERHRDDAALVAALGHTQLDRRAPALGQELRHEIVVGDLSTRRDFSDVRDVVRAYRLLAEKGISGEVYNIASGVDVGLFDIAQRLVAAIAPHVRLVTDESLLRPVEVPVSLGSYEKLRRATNWRPTISLDTSLNDVIIEMRRRRGDS